MEAFRFLKEFSMAAFKKSYKKTRKTVRRNPVESVVAAGAVGAVIGSAVGGPVGGATGWLLVTVACKVGDWASKPSRRKGRR